MNKFNGLAERPFQTAAIKTTLMQASFLSIAGTKLLASFYILRNV
jgi:hypothetical protein